MQLANNYQLCFSYSKADMGSLTQTTFLGHTEYETDIDKLAQMFTWKN